VAVAASASGNDPGQSTFEVHCATCHAPNGSGDSVVGKSMKIPDLRSPAVQSQPDAQLADVIANGKGLMPGFKSSLSNDEIDALVKHVHQLAEKRLCRNDGAVSNGSLAVVEIRLFYFWVV